MQLSTPIDDLEQKINQLNAEITKIRTSLTEYERTKQESLIRFQSEQVQLQTRQQGIQTKLDALAQTHEINEAKYQSELEKVQLAYAVVSETINVETTDLSEEKARLEMQLATIKKDYADMRAQYQVEQDVCTTDLKELQEDLAANIEQQQAFVIQNDRLIAELNSRLQMRETEVQQKITELNCLNEELAAEIPNSTLINNEINVFDPDDQGLLVAADQVPLLSNSDSPADHFLRKLAITKDLLTQLFVEHPEPHLTLKWYMDGLNVILSLENGITGILRWATLDILLIKLCQGVVKTSSLRPPQNLEEMEARSIQSRMSFSKSTIFPRGRTLLLQSSSARFRLQATAGFVEGLEHALMSTVHITLWGVLIYELILPALEHRQVDPWQVLNIFRRYEEVGSNSVVRFLAKLPPNITSTVIPAFILLSSSTLAYLHARHAGHFNEKQYKKFLEELTNLKVNWFKDNLGFLFSLRWVIPFSLLPPLFFESPFVLAEQWILQEGAMTPQQSREIWGVLKNFGLNHSRFLQREALHTIANIAHGIALKDLIILREAGVSEDKLATLILIKLEAFAILRSLGARFNLDDETKGIYHRYLKPLSRFVYANYLLWWLGYQNYLLRSPALSKLAGLGYLIAKIAKLAFEVQLVRLIINSILAAIQCPDLPYFKFGQETPVYANKLDLDCFTEVFNLFRSLPGQENQSIAKLTAMIPDFDFWIRNVSGNPIKPGLTRLFWQQKYLRAFETAQILNALAIHKGNGVDLQAIDLSNQVPPASLRFPENGSTYCDTNPQRCLFWTGMSELTASLSIWENLTQFAYMSNSGIYQMNAGNDSQENYIAFGKGLSLLTSLESLNLAYNVIGYFGNNATAAIGQGLRYLTRLKNLKLTSNMINANGAVDIGNALAYLTQLEALVLDSNMIGAGSTCGEEVIGKSLFHQTGLLELDLGENFIGSAGTLGEQILGENLRFLTNLHTLGLNLNAIGSTGTQGEEAIGASLRFLPQLNYLMLWGNKLGFTGTNGTEVLGNNLRYLTSLADLRLDANSITFHGPKGALAIAQSLPYLTKLISLSMDGNNITSNDFDVFIKLLTAFLMNPFKINPPYYGRNVLLANLNSLQQTRLIELVPPVHLTTVCFLASSATDVIDTTVFDYYLKSLPNDSQDLINGVGVMGGMGDYNSDVLYPTCKLPISDALIMTLGKYLPKFTSLTTLILGAVNLNLSEAATSRLADSLTALQSLYRLGLSLGIGSNSSTGIKKIGNSLRYLTQLGGLSLGGNYLGLTSSDGVVAISNSLTYLSKLEELSFYNSSIGLTDTKGEQSLGYSLRFLPSLVNLDLGLNQIGSQGDDGIMAISQSLPYLTQLQYLYLQQNNIGTHGTTGEEALGYGLGHLPRLWQLSLANNSIGSKGSAGTQVIGRNIAYLSRVVSMDLSHNAIGSTDTLGTEAIAQGLAHLNNKLLLEILLDHNQIGAHGPAGIGAIANAMKTIQPKVFFNLDANNISSTVLFNLISAQRYRVLNQSCNDHRCHANTQISSQVNNQSMNSAATRLSIPSVYVYLAQIFSLTALVKSKNSFVLQNAFNQITSVPSVTPTCGEQRAVSIDNSVSMLFFMTTLVALGSFTTQDKLKILAYSLLFTWALADENSLKNASSTLVVLALNKIIEKNLIYKLTDFFANRLNRSEHAYNDTTDCGVSVPKNLKPLPC